MKLVPLLNHPGKFILERVRFISMKRYPVHSSWFLLFLLISIFFVGYFFLRFQFKAYADANSATASMSPSALAADTTDTFTFSLTNSGTAAILFLTITRPTDAVSLVGTNVSGWQKSTTSNSITLWGNSIASGGNITFGIAVRSGSTIQAPIDWIVTASPNTNGSNSFSVSGSLSLTVGNYLSPTPTPTHTPIPTATPTTTSTPIPTSTTSPTSASATTTPTPTSTATTVVIVTATPLPTSSTTVSTVAPTPTITANPTPTLDILPPTLEINNLTEKIYNRTPLIKGLAADPGGIKQILYSVNNNQFLPVPGVSSRNQFVTFSFTPVDLTISGLYSIIIKTIDEANNVSISRPINFTLDNVSPRIVLETSLSGISSRAPPLIGFVTDSSGVTQIEFSANGGLNWQPLMIKNSGERAVFIADIPDPTEEGIYELVFRASDTAGNITVIGPYTLTVDRLAPSAGIFLIRSGNTLLSPDSIDGYSGMTGFPFTFIISTVGGVIQGSITFRSSGSEVVTLPLSKTPRSNIWEVTFNPDTPGIREVVIQLSDGINPPVTEKLTSLNIKSPRCAREMGKKSGISSHITLRSFDLWQGKYTAWNGPAHDQINPLPAEDGCYAYLVPAGKYQLQIKAPLYDTVETDALDVYRVSFISYPVTLYPNRCVKLGLISFCLPWTRQIYLPAVPENLQTEGTGKAGQNIRNLEKVDDLFSQIEGKEALVLVVNSWFPGIDSLLDKIKQIFRTNNRHRILVIFPQESIRYVETWKKQAGYDLDIVADPDGLITSSLDLHTGPYVISIDKGGFINKITADISDIFKLASNN